MQLHGAWQVHEAAARGLDATVVVRVDAVVRTEHVRVRHRPGVVAGLIPSPPVGRRERRGEHWHAPWWGGLITAPHHAFD
jgi:hypothetical protein